MLQRYKVVKGRQQSLNIKNVLLTRYSSMANISTACFCIAVVIQNNTWFYFTLIHNNITITHAIEHVLQDMMKDYHLKVLYIFCYIFSLGILMHKWDGGWKQKKGNIPRQRWATICLLHAKQQLTVIIE